MIKVPFYKQTNSLNCASTVLHMVLSYFDPMIKLNQIESFMDIQEGKSISTSQIALAAAQLGYNVKFFSQHLGLNEENLKLDYYKTYGSQTAEALERRYKKLKQLKVEIKEVTFSLDELLEFLSEESIPIVLLNWNVFSGKPGYQGHFAPIIGYDEFSVFIHNSGLNDGAPNISIAKELFDKARKSQGTDEDIVIISSSSKK